jgi:hypothetical protein
VKFDYVDQLMLQTLAPLCVIALTFLVLKIHMSTLSDTKFSKKRKIVSVYASFFFFVTFLVLPAVTTTIFGSFFCRSIDPDNIVPGIPKYLENDLSIACDSDRYRFGVIWAIVMVFVYPVGISAVYFYCLYINRNQIMRATTSETGDDEEGHHEHEHEHEHDAYHDEDGETYKDSHRESVCSVQSRRSTMSTIPHPTVRFDDISSQNRLEIRRNAVPVIDVTHVERRNWIMLFVTPKEVVFLYKEYEPQFWYWEVLETSRRLLLTAFLSVLGGGKDICFALDNNAQSTQYTVYTIVYMSSLG